MQLADISGRSDGCKNVTSVPLAAVGCSANEPTALGLSFLAYKVGVIVIVLSSEMFCRD